MPGPVPALQKPEKGAVLPRIELRSLNNFVLKDVSFTIDDGEFMILLGRNGAGKSTLLNIIAGLIDYEGTVLFDGKAVDTLHSEERNVGYLFQNLALFPHMDVKSNIAYGLRMRGTCKKSNLSEKVHTLLQMVHVAHLADRYPRDLSGGERQRVALARAVATRPDILLMDEPLASMDLRSAKYMRTDFKRLQRELGCTTLFVTHNLTEAAEMADRIALIDNGRLLQTGTPEEIFFAPADDRVRRFIGEPNILECQSSRIVENGLAIAYCGELPVFVPYEGGPIRKIVILPEHIYVSIEAPAGPHINRFKGVVRNLRRDGSTVRLALDVRGHTILAELPYNVCEMLHLARGSVVHMILKLRWIQTLND